LGGREIAQGIDEILSKFFGEFQENFGKILGVQNFTKTATVSIAIS